MTSRPSIARAARSGNLSDAARKPEASVVRSVPPSRQTTACCLFERNRSVLELFSVGRNVDDERFDAKLDVSCELARDRRVAADQVRAKGLVILERAKPVRSFDGGR